MGAALPLHLHLGCLISYSFTAGSVLHPSHPHFLSCRGILKVQPFSPSPAIGLWFIDPINKPTVGRDLRQACKSPCKHKSNPLHSSPPFLSIFCLWSLTLVLNSVGEADMLCASVSQVCSHHRKSSTESWCWSDGELESSIVSDLPQSLSPGLFYSLSSRLTQGLALLQPVKEVLCL